MNILVLLADQQRADTIEKGTSCRTPNLDRLADAGVRFERAYTPNSICSPARASLMTGLYPSRHGMVDVTHNVPRYRAELEPGLTMWPELLRRAGYRTGYFGKWHIERSDNPLAYGFEEYVPCHSREYKEYRRSMGLPPKPQPVHGYRLAQPGYDTRLHYGVYEEPAEATEPYYLYSRGIEFIRRQGGQAAPWAAVISVLEPHDPYLAPKCMADRYPSEQIPLPSNLRDTLPNKPNIVKRLQSVWETMTDEQVRQAIACYYAMCTLVDEQVGRLLQALDDTGQLDDTLIVYTSDHGDMLGNHGLFLKGVTAYEEVYRVPLIVSGAGVRQPGRSTPAVVSLVDIAATLTEAAGLPAMESDGRSLLPHLRDRVSGEELRASWQTGYAEFFGQRLGYSQRIVWNERWKYTFNGFDYDELYDLYADPGEMNNVAGLPEFRGVLEEMAARMWSRVHRLGDTSLGQSHYGMFRFAPVGPLAGENGI